MPFAYTRLVGGATSPPPSLPQPFTHHRPTRSLHRIILLFLLFLLSFICVFFFTASLSLLIIGDVRHSRDGVLLLDTSDSGDYFDDQEYSSNALNGVDVADAEPSSLDDGEAQAEPETSSYYLLDQTDQPNVESWAQAAARFPKISRSNLSHRQHGQPFSSHHLLNLENFSFHLMADRSTDQCSSADFGHQQSAQSSSPLNLVILIHSAVEHFGHRQLLRRTWLHLDKKILHQVGSSIRANVVHAFVLGETASEEMQAAVQMEHRLYGDIVQARFEDSYHNLTYKHLASLRWAAQSGCAASADYLFKVDDDAFVDTYAVIEFLAARKKHHHRESSRPSQLVCSVFPEGTAPKRTGKWTLPYSLYPYESFPSYCSGVGYFITPDLALDLLEVEARLPDEFPLIQIDDVFVTGLLRSVLKPVVKPIPANGRYVYDVRKLRRWLREGIEDCPSGYLIGDIGNEEDRYNLAIKLWNKTERGWRRRRAGKCPQRRPPYHRHHHKSVKISSL